MKKTIALLIAVSVCGSLFIDGCATTAMYGRTLEPDPRTPGQFTFKVYTGGTAWRGAAKERAIREIEKYMAKHNYSKYEIMDEQCVLLGASGCTFVVKLER